jgi:hypothetical protein
MQHSAEQHESAPVAPPIPSEQILEQLDRVLAGRPLRESQQLRSFLEFVVRETLDGRSDGLKEYVLGTRVFGRRQDYEPRHDGIVRVQATVLRKRLEKYYQEEGASDPVILELPRGGYVPSFRLRAVDPEPQPEAEALVPVVTIAPPVSAARSRSIKVPVAFAAGCLLSAIVCFLFYRMQAPAPKPFMVTTATAADFPQLWGPFFANGAQSLVAYGVPLFFSGNGLYIRDVGVNTQDEGDQSRIRKFAETFQISPQPVDDLYTGVGEVESTYRLSNFFATRGIPVRVVNARMLGTSELAGRNVVAVSSLRFQTLLSELRLPHEFVFRPTTPESIENRKPLPGEQPVYTSSTGAGVSTSYAVVSVWPGATSGTRIMHIGGVHTWSTQAAVEFMLQPEQLRKMAAEFDRDRRTGARGPVSPYFQILLRVEGRGNQPHRLDYVTHHYLPAGGS